MSPIVEDTINFTDPQNFHNLFASLLDHLSVHFPLIPCKLYIEKSSYFRHTQHTRTLDHSNMFYMMFIVFTRFTRSPSCRDGHSNRDILIGLASQNYGFRYSNTKAIIAHWTQAKPPIS